ncbi:hypothetical protein IM511_01200 [Erythrobacteraceae bacterium E2-1 Yellow Sea]|nr:hypothetical protein [Erythrobacteraceae bacterium E2-1 Yellow Sea]
MTKLPHFVRRLPYVFYALAVVFLVWNLGNSWVSMSNMMTYPDPSLEGIMAYQKSLALYSAFLEAAYLLANGAIIHVLIAIFDKLKGPAE